jgi:uncharacterized membrane protein YhaH (DUF805 family)
MSWFTLAIRRTFELAGRSRRREYWAFQLLWIVALVVASLMTMSGTRMLIGLVAVLGLIPAFTVTARRLHDINRSAWWMLVVFVPVVGGLILMVMTLLPGTPGDNDFGDQPAED